MPLSIVAQMLSWATEWVMIILLFPLQWDSLQQNINMNINMLGNFWKNCDPWKQHPMTIWNMLLRYKARSIRCTGGLVSAARVQFRLTGKSDYIGEWTTLRSMQRRFMKVSPSLASASMASIPWYLIHAQKQFQLACNFHPWAQLFNMHNSSLWLSTPWPWESCCQLAFRSLSWPLGTMLTYPCSPTSSSMSLPPSPVIIVGSWAHVSWAYNWCITNQG